MQREGVTAVGADGPDVAGRLGGDADQEARRSGSAGIRAFQVLPGRAVPVLDQGLVNGAGGVPSDRPGVMPGSDGYSRQAVGMARSARVRALHALPGRAIPVLDQGLAGSTLSAVS